MKTGLIAAVTAAITFSAGLAAAEPFTTTLRQDCPNPAEHAAGESNTTLDVTFVNQTDQTLSIVWIDYAGSLVSYGSIAPGKSLDISTFVNHAWLAVDGEGSCHGGILRTDPAVPVMTIS